MAPSGTWADLPAQAIFHALAASLFVEALVRGWRVREPGQRIALRAVGLAWPILPFWLVLGFLPRRGEDDFAGGLALLDGRLWARVAPLGVPLLHVFVVGLAAAGALLFLMDLVPLLRSRRRPRPAPSQPDAESAGRIGMEIRSLAPALGVPPPPILFVALDAAMLFSAGVRRPTVVVSQGALALLDPAELRAALAHELAHVARRDPAWSWLLFAARALLFWNPAFQVLSRAVLHDVEWQADDRAARACGDRVALASALLKLFRASRGWRWPVRRTLPFAPVLAEPLERARTLDIEVRCRRLLDPPDEPLPFGRARVTLAAAFLTGILIFVV
ncbi:MAG TPA: M56 family metallopeptidase [Anaeromyxobacteraceae bacterium]|nr:M56 family metallopeptidase [Anaeromyxobacteraceae bacterium]